MTRRPRRGSLPRGFTLLELLVAFAIMGLSLGLLYRATGGSARNVAEIERHTQASELAESLLALHDGVPPFGWNEAGQSAGFGWQARSLPYAGGVDDSRAPPLHEVLISIWWDEGGRRRQIELATLRPERRPPPGGVVP